VTSDRAPLWRERAVLFARNFVKHPKMLGSLIPSSPFLINRLLRRVDWAGARVIVEYGPGVGNFTTEILRRMRPDAMLIVFETNDDFVAFLRRSITDARLVVIHGSAADVGRVLAERGVDRADYVISGIPYSTMPAPIRDAILHATRAALGDTGTLLVYQFSRASLPYVHRVFERVELDFEPLNILPATLYICRAT
jgi:phospholipid N-methyltransferase